MIDVKNKVCQANNCIQRPNYGFENQKALYCMLHKKDDMIDIVSKTCSYENCKKIPTYGFKNQKV